MKKRVASSIRVLILCEGVTEEGYAKVLRSEYLPREIQRIERNPYNHVWLFFDHDNFPRLKDAFDEITKHNFKTAFSAISLEYWFILHFEECGKVFSNGEECLKHLKKSWPNYHKTQINHFKELGSYITKAIERAEKIELKPKVY